jgi:hypothetical protein
VPLNGGGRPIPPVTSLSAAGNRCSSKRVAQGSNLGRIRAEKLTIVWSSTAVCSSEGELPVVALSGEHGGRNTGQRGAPRWCDARGWVSRVDPWPGVAGDGEESTEKEWAGAMASGRSLARRLETSRAQWLEEEVHEVLEALSSTAH